jgi:hypothetical protein
MNDTTDLLTRQRKCSHAGGAWDRLAPHNAEWTPARLRREAARIGPVTAHLVELILAARETS